MSEARKHDRFQIVDARDGSIVTSFTERGDWNQWYEQHPNLNYRPVDADAPEGAE